jgi:hypothetical protein
MLSGIKVGMPRRPLLLFPLLLFFAVIGSAQTTPGTFLGVIVEPPEDSQKQGILFLRGRNGMIRAVEFSKAKVEWAEELPENDRLGTPHEALQPGSEIRVTANQSPDGEWHAQRIEITIRAHIPQVSRGEAQVARAPRRQAR